MRGARRAALALLLCAPVLAGAQEPPPLQPTPTPEPPKRLDILFGEYLAAGNAGGREAALERMLQRRAELNIRNLTGPAMALVSYGLAQLDTGDATAAEQSVRAAAQLDPDLADPRFALRRVGAGNGLRGFVADAETWQGATRLATFALGCLLLGVMGAVVALGFTMLLRHGRLLVHDLRENASSNSFEVLAPGLAAAVLLLPLLLFQGWGWVPLWWMAVLFVYMSGRERVAAVLALLLSVALGPAITALEQRQSVESNPLLWAGLRTLNGPADERDFELLQSLRQAHPDDRDLDYLVALQHEKQGRAELAEQIYVELLRSDPADPVALNNLANIRYGRGEVSAASRAYRQVGDSSAGDRVRGTALYNLSIASLQQFDFDESARIRENADALARAETSRYESQWSYETPAGSAVSATVSLGPSSGELAAKVAGTSEGVARENLTGTGVRISPLPTAAALLTRLSAFAVVFLIGWVGVRVWRGGVLVTRRCLKCGTPFSRRSRAGTDATELCMPCYHLYVVKDGISVPARKAKLAEVGSWEVRRKVLVRLLSLVSPGAGHGYGGSPIACLLLGLVWYALLGTLTLLVLGTLPLTEAPASLAGTMPRTLVAVPLAVTWLIANVVGPGAEHQYEVPQRSRHEED